VLERSKGLTDEARNAIAALERRCVAADGGRLKLEWGALGHRDPTDVNDLLWWHDGTLVAFCGRYSFGGGVPEATGMVDPAHRRQGIGTAMLRELRVLCGEHGDARVLLVTPRSCAAAKALAEQQGGVFEHAEHALVLTELHGVVRVDESVTLRTATSADTDAVHRLLDEGFGHVGGPVVGEDAMGATLIAERDGVAVATMRVAYDEGSRGIYGFVVDPALRGQGIGRDLLRRVCEDALEHGATFVHLEVSTDNDRALNLYTSVGFELETTEDYYELASI
jgi:ribosomal protein S18 acetylase RimI-like enzyme